MDDALASDILASERPFAPLNRDLFFTYLHPDWEDSPPPERARGVAPDEESVRERLAAFLETRFPRNPERVQAGLSVFTDPVAREKLGPPTLRAALAALTGTLGEPAIEFLLYRTPVRLVQFGVQIDRSVGVPGHIAESYVSPDGTRYIVIDRAYRFNRFGTLTALLAHEILHTGADDDEAGLPEEVIASSVEALIYMQMLLTDPSLALLPDELTRGNNNPMAVARLNSGPPGSDRLTLFVPGSRGNVDPLSVEPVSEFAAYRLGDPALAADPEVREKATTGNWLLARILERLSEAEEMPLDPDAAAFDGETLAFVDQNQAVLSPSELVTVACILELDVSSQ